MASSSEADNPAVDLENGRGEDSGTVMSLFCAVGNTYRNGTGDPDVVQPYLEFIQQQLRLHQGTLIDPVLCSLLGANVVDEIERVTLISNIAAEFRTPKSGQQTLKHITSLVCKRYNVADERVSKKETYQVVFLVLGWLSMLFKAKVDLERLDTLQVYSPSGQSIQRLALFQRPVINALRSLGIVLPGSRQWGQDTEASILHVANLNFFSLKTIGGVRIQWVDTLSEHLDFDPTSRTLRLFRFPSVCTLAFNNGDGSCLDR